MLRVAQHDIDELSRIATPTRARAGRSEGYKDKTLSVRQAERADVAAGEKSSDDVAAGDRQIEMRRVRLVVMNGYAQWSRAAQMIARQGLQGIYRRLVVGAFDAQRDALARLEQTRRRHDGNFNFINLSRFQ